MLPLLPGTFKLGIREKRTEEGCMPDPAAARQLETIRSLLSRSDTAITATDASREGELAARYVYGQLGFKGEVKRLWITSLTDKAIRDGLRRLRPQSAYDSLYRAGKARREADWLAGCNASLALGFAAGRRNHSLGRVQTPVLALVCRRYLESRERLPQPRYRLCLVTVKDGETAAFTSTAVYADRKEAETVRERLAARRTARVVSAVKEETAEEPPLLHNLTGLQCEANLRLGFTARQTLAILQGLYERGYVSHPRTASRHIGREALESMPALLAAMKGDPRFARHAEALEGRPLNLHAVDDGKAAGHHALLVTDNSPSGLSVGEQAVRSMIAGRMLEAFSDCCRREVTDIRLECGDVRFEAQARVTLQEGWTAVYGKGGGEEDTALPDFQPGETLPAADISVEPVPAEAPQPFTEAALLAAMEENGLGTPGTRANVIELLVARHYMERRDGHLLPTPKGLEVYGIVKDKLIADAAMTAQWEQALRDIESGKADAAAFMEQVREHTRHIVEELSEARLEHAGPARCRCPKCGGETVSLFRKVAACGDPDCAFHLFRLFNGRELTDGELLLLLQGGSTPFLGFTSKKGLPYEASLRMDENYRIEMTFRDSRPPGVRQSAGNPAVE